MKKNKGYKYRIYPNIFQREFFEKCFGACRWLWNEMLEDRSYAYEKYDVTIIPQPAWYKTNFPFLKEVDSLALANVQIQLNNSFNNFFKKNTKYPKYKSKRSYKQSYTTNNQKGSIRLSDDSKYIRLPKVKDVRIKLHRELPKNCTIRSVTVSKTATGKYYVSICVEYDESQVINNTNNDVKVCGLDYVSNGLYVDDKGISCNMPAYYRNAERSLARQQRKLSRKKPFSNKWYKQKLKVAKLQEKTANQRLDFLHKKSNELAKEYDIIGVEDINMQEISKTLHLGKATYNNSFGMFRNFLAYKLEDKNKHFIKVSKTFPSTQLCNNCGHKNEDIKGIKNLKIRKWECPECHKTNDRDINAARNIRDEALRICLSQ